MGECMIGKLGAKSTLSRENKLLVRVSITNGRVLTNRLEEHWRSEVVRPAVSEGELRRA